MKEGPITATQLAKRMGCAKAAAYRRIRAVREIAEQQGHSVFERKKREAERGPESVEYLFT